MSTIVTRAGKGSALTWTEADANFTNLNTDKYQSGDSAVFASVTNGGVLSTGYASSYSYIIGTGATPVQWDNSGTTYGYQLGSNGFFVNRGNTYTQLIHGMRVDSSGNQVYTTTGVSPVWINLSGGSFSVYGAASGTAGDTISAVIPPLLVDCQTNTVSINADSISGVSGIGFRNRLINGNFRVDQRNSGVATAAVAGGTTYAADRWQAFEDTDGGYTTDSDVSTSPPEGFASFLRVTVTSADASLGAAQFAVIQQKIEGINCFDLDFGLSTAKAVTLSFRVRSSLTGTFSGSLRNSASNRSYPFTYTISSANVWETQSITVAGDTSGTWLTDSGIGLTVCFSLGCGSTNLGTANAWAGAQYLGATGETPLIGTNAATWDITGVQLEAGSVATPFEREAYNVQLAKCQRYYERFSVPSGSYLTQGYCYSTTACLAALPFSVTKRAVPTASDISAASTWDVLNNAGAGINASTASVTLANTTLHQGRVDVTVAAGLTGGNATIFVARAGQTATVGFSAEL